MIRRNRRLSILDSRNSHDPGNARARTCGERDLPGQERPDRVPGPNRPRRPDLHNSAERSRTRQITNVDGDATAPDWSPDGRRIAFTFNECSVGIMDADGSDLSLIADDSSMCQSDPSFTPDGTRLVFGHFDWLGTGLHEIWSMKPDGSDKRVVTGAGETDPNVSPDGRQLSFKDSDVGALCVQNMDGSGLVQVSPTVSVAYKHDWAPDGQHLVFSDNSEPGPTDAVNIAIVRPDGSGMEYITHETAPVIAYVGSYSPDGQWIVWRLVKDGLFTLYRMRPDGSERHAILSSPTFVARNIDWGPAAQR